MTKSIITFFSILFISSLAFGQRDLITTKTGEQIRCKILDETATAFKFAYIGPKQKVLRNQIYKNMVSSFKYNQYPNDLINLKSKKSNESILRFESTNKDATLVDTTHKNVYAAEFDKKSEFSHFLKYRVGLKGGAGYLPLIKNDASAYGLYKNKQNYGSVFGADAYVFVNDHLGLGLAFSSFTSKNSNKNLDYPDLITGTSIIGGELENRISHKFMGPSMIYRRTLSYRSFITATVSPSYVMYKDKGITNKSGFEFTGNTIGTTASLGYDILLGNDIFGRDILLCFEAGLAYAELTKLNYGNTVGVKTLSTPLRISRGEFTVGLRFTRFPFSAR